MVRADEIHAAILSTAEKKILLLKYEIIEPKTGQYLHFKPAPL